MLKTILKIFYPAIVVAGCLFAAGNEIYAQCGPDGTQPCASKTPVQSKQPGINNSAKIRAERPERLRAERERLRRKQLEKQNVKNSPEWMKNVIEYGKATKNGTQLELFPVAGVTLGKTGSKLLSLMGENCGITGKNGKLTECYVVEGITFYCDENNLSDSLYLTKLRVSGMPENWRQNGFDWNLSYNGWVNLFKQKGYESLATEKPTVAVQSGKRFLRAELLTVVNTTAGRAQIVLNFDFGIGKTTANDPRTLFSISIDKFN